MIVAMDNNNIPSNPAYNHFDLPDSIFNSDDMLPQSQAQAQGQQHSTPSFDSFFMPRTFEQTLELSHHPDQTQAQGHSHHQFLQQQRNQHIPDLQSHQNQSRPQGHQQRQMSRQQVDSHPPFQQQVPLPNPQVEPQGHGHGLPSQLQPPSMKDSLVFPSLSSLMTSGAPPHKLHRHSHPPPIPHSHNHGDHNTSGSGTSASSSPSSASPITKTKTTPKSKVPPKPKFSPDDDSLLIELKEHRQLTWRQIAKHFDGRTAGALQVRYCTKLKARNTSWLDEDVEELQKAIDEYEADRWAIIADKMGNKYSPAACKEKYVSLTRAVVEHEVRGRPETDMVNDMGNGIVHEMVNEKDSEHGYDSTVTL